MVNILYLYDNDDNEYDDSESENETDDKNTSLTELRFTVNRNESRLGKTSRAKSFILFDYY